jgi:hypothetical protein
MTLALLIKIIHISMLLLEHQDFYGTELLSIVQVQILCELTTLLLDELLRQTGTGTVWL